jgi:DNA-binding transcriptional regulator YiaG
MLATPDFKVPVLIGRDKPLRDPATAERAITSAIRAFLKQSEALAAADYSCSLSIADVRRLLKKDKDDFAMMLGVSRETLNTWEAYLLPQQVASAMSFTVKSVDSMFRLISFAGGGPDSRPDFSLGDLLKYLTSDQFETFSGWVEEGRARASKKQPDGLAPM